MSDSVQPRRRQPIRLLGPWDSPGKNAGVGCHLLLQCMNLKSESEVTQSCPALSDPMDCSPPGPLSMGFPRQEYWSRVPLPSLQILLLNLIRNDNNCYLGFCLQFSSVAQSCPTLCDPVNHSMPGLPVHHQLPEFTQTHSHRVSDAIQPSHPLSSPSSPAPNPSQNQSLFQ